jgi:hypothetical protein
MSDSNGKILWNILEDSRFTTEQEDQIIGGSLRKIQPKDAFKEFELASKSGPISASLYTVLNYVFDVRWKWTKKTDEERLKLVRLFETNYPHCKDFVRWYQNIESKIPEMHWRANQSRKHLEECKKLKKILVASKKHDVESGFDWRKQADQFRSISTRDFRSRGLEPLYVSGSVWDGNLKGGNNRDRNHYKDLAGQSVSALGYLKGKNGLHTWHMLLMCNTSQFNPTETCKDNLCEASAQYCEDLAIKFHLPNANAAGKKKQKQGALTSNKGGRPNTTSARNRLVDQILKELNCTPSDPRFWPSFEARAENKIITIPGQKGLDKFKWTTMSDNDRDKAHETVLRQHREYREGQKSSGR